MKIRFHKFLLSIITTAASLSFTAPVWAAAEARFTDGGLIDQAVRPNDPMGVQDAVDAVPGMKGEGWLGPWRVATNGCCGRKVIVNDGNPLNSGGPCLSVDLEMSPKWPCRQMYVVRTYDNLEAPSSFAFDFRLDSTRAFESEEAFFLVACSATTGAGNLPSEISSEPFFPEDSHLIWAVRCGAGNWLVYNGSQGSDFDKSRYVDTGFPANEGDEYHFEVAMNPSGTWTVKIQNLTAKTSWQSKDLGLAGGDPFSKGGGAICFGGGNATASTHLAFSIDSLLIK
jgi:hypothetical protein